MAEKKCGKLLGKVDKFFGISARNSNFKTEIMAGLTTFFAMCYIVVTNPNQMTGFEQGLDSIWNAVFIAGIIAAVIGTVLTAVIGKMPFAQAAGMGLNSFFYVCFVMKASDKLGGYQSGLVLILLSGIIFLILSITGARKAIAKALPDCLKKAIPAGIGLFIAFIGFKNAGIVVADRHTFVGLLDLRQWIVFDDYGAIIGGAGPALAAFLGLILIGVLGKFKVKGNIILGILASTVFYYLFTWTLPVFNWGQIGQSFVDFGNVGVSSIFKAESWVNAFTATGVFNAITIIITFCLIDMFDTVGTLYGAASAANMLDENGDPINIDGCLMADSVATVAGAVLGTSTVTTYVESSAGVAAGGRTGFASIVTAFCFALCLFLSPIASIIPGFATAPALVYVGVLMLTNFGKVDLSDITNAIPAFLALILMPLTYSIANGIGVGTIAYVLLKLFTGKYDKKDIIVTIIAILFIVRFILTFTGTYPE